MTDNPRPRPRPPWGTYTGCSYCDTIPGQNKCVCDQDDPGTCSHKVRTMVGMEPDGYGKYTVKLRCDLCKRVDTYKECTPTKQMVEMATPEITETECGTVEVDE